MKEKKLKSKTKSDKKLTGKALIFCKEYIVDLNAAQAAIRAGYSKKTAKEQGARLLTNVNIRSEVDRLKAERAARVEVSSDDVLRELVRLSRADIRKVWGEDGALIPVHEWPDEIAACVASVEVEELFEGTGKDRKFIGYTKKVKFWEKTKALDMLGRHLKLFNQDADRGDAPAVILIDKVGATYGIA